jgi:hydroxyacylglutathione hydrolase
MNVRTVNLFAIMAICIVLGGCGTKNPVLHDSDTLRVTLLSSGGANVYIVDRSGKRLMIDSGNPGDEQIFEALMLEQGISPDTIDYLILTHAHMDHAGTAAHFQEQWGITVIGGRADQSILDRQGQDDICPTSFLARVIQWMNEGKRYQKLQLDIPIEDNFDLGELGIEGTILPLPGHTPGSLVVAFDDQVFVGDLIRGSLAAAEEAATHFFMCDLAENRTRIRGLLEHRDLQRWHPGHMGAFDVDAVHDYLATQDPRG